MIDKTVINLDNTKLLLKDKVELKQKYSDFTPIGFKWNDLVSFYSSLLTRSARVYLGGFEPPTTWLISEVSL